MELRRATRKQAKLRIGLSAASGFGKTYSALLLAYGIAGDWEKIAVIDTEHGSAELYSDLGDYNVLPLEGDFSPERYIKAIKTCEEAGMEVIIIDSITHEWEGKGGCLEIVESLGGRYQDWAKVTPRHQKFIEAILQSKAHVITTVRRKQDYTMSTDEKGKVKVEKAGLKEVTRDGFEYELTLNFEITNDRHLAKASKDRTGLYMSRPEFVITTETGQELKKWAEKGISVVELAIEELKSCTDRTCTSRVYTKYKHLQDNEQFMAAVKEMSEKFPKEQPAPEQTQAESKQAETAAPEESTPVKYATAKQKEEIIRLLNNPVITRQEKSKMLLNINRFDEERAAQAIGKLTNIIAEREGESKDKPAKKTAKAEAAA